ncbi:MAG: tyrosine--tRNA ligase [Chlamydiales bacterium]
MKNIINFLQDRHFIDAITSEELLHLSNKPLTAYIGFDPTSDSLHLGNLVPIIGLGWLQRFGHTPIALVGGATGMIGDPSGKSIERTLLDEETIEHNLKGIRRSLHAVLKTEVPILNNYDWFCEIGYVDFLRTVGKHFRLGTMLAKESVKNRLSSQEGMSYTEFSYQILQAYDFYHLNKHHNVVLQMGGSDQWGNITAGTELVYKMSNTTVYGATYPLLTRSDGKKFGKTEEGAIWLNSDKLSPYDFYQYLFRVPDMDVGKMFRMLTFLETEEIIEIEASMQRKGYVANTAQKRLAEEITRLVHGEKGVEEALRITQAAKPGSCTSLDRETLEALAAEIPSTNLSYSDVIGKKLIDIFLLTDMLPSKGEARRLIINGGAYLNNEKIMDEYFVVQRDHLIEGELFLLGVGKKKKRVVRVVNK